MSEFNLKLMNIDADEIGIPDTEYEAYVNMPCAEYRKVVNDLSVISDNSMTKSNL
jgi:proliferating cell nuclear antigen